MKQGAVMLTTVVLALLTKVTTVGQLHMVILYTTVLYRMS